MDTPAAQVEFYKENGYLVVENLVSKSDIERLKKDMLLICRGKYPCKEIKPLPDAMTDDEVLRNFLCIHQCHRVSPFMLEMAKHPGMAEIMSRIIAPDVKCMQSMLFVKPPNFQGQAWHQDELYIPTRDRSLCGGWIAIDDATIQNGCLWVVPGSHKTGYLYPQRPHTNPDEFDFAPESYGFDESKEVPVEVKAGTVVYFNGYLLHRSKKNRSDIFRRVLVNHYMNAYSLLPWSLSPEDAKSVGVADYRDIVMVAGTDPYAWKGTTPRGGIWLRECKALREPAAAGAK